MSMAGHREAIIFVHLYNDYSGSPTVLKEAIESVNSVPAKRFLVTSQHQGALSGVSAKVLISPYLYFDNKIARLLAYLCNQLFTFCLLFGLLVSLRLVGFRITVVTNTILPFSANVVARIVAHKLICYIHESSLNPQSLFLFLSWIVRRCSDQRVYVSDYVRAVYEDAHGQVVLNGLNEKLANKTNGLISLENKDKSILFVGSLRPYKGFPVFIELARKRPELSFLAVINASDDAFKSFKDNVLQWPCNLRVVLRPDDLSAYYRSSRLLLNLTNPSMCKETFGLTILEGFAFSCPAIVPQEGGHLSFCNDDNCVKLNTASLSELLPAVDLLFHDTARWRRMSNCAYETSLTLTGAVYKRNISKAILGYSL